MAFCAGCGSVMPEAAVACPRCGRAARRLERSSPIPDMLAGPLAYLFFPAIVFLVLEPYRKNRFVRFHSLQAIVFFVGSNILMGLVAFLGFFAIVIGPVLAIGLLILWLVLLVKAYQQEMWRIPFIGDWLERYCSI